MAAAGAAGVVVVASAAAGADVTNEVGGGLDAGASCAGSMEVPTKSSRAAMSGMIDRGDGGWEFTFLGLSS